MTDFLTPLKRVSVFGGGEGGQCRSGIRDYYQKWLNGTLLETEQAAIDAMWLAADLGRILTRFGYQIIHGGYDAGVMGMLARSSTIFSRRYKTSTTPIGVPIPNYFPDDPHSMGNILPAQDLFDRLSKLIIADAFIVLRGNHGTLQELSTVLENEDYKQDATHQRPELGFKSSPIIIADPTGKMFAYLRFVFGEQVVRFKHDTTPNIIDRVYLLGNDCFERDEGRNPLNSTLNFSCKGEKEITNIINYYLGDRAAEITSPTLRSLL